MNISIILAHPSSQSYNHAIAYTAMTILQQYGHQVAFHDLYAEHFDPLLFHAEFPKGAPLPPEIAAHSQEIAKANGIIIVHPNWWGQPPAILKGWIDRVLRPDVAYRFLEGDQSEGLPIGLLKAKAALVFNTSNTRSERERDVFGDPLELLWKNCIFDLCGVSTFYREMFCVVVTSTEDQRCQWLQEVQAVVARYFP